MKIGLNTYEQRPQFKASFAKTAETKKALKAFCEKDHYRLYEIKTVFLFSIIDVYILAFELILLTSILPILLFNLLLNPFLHKLHKY